MLAEKDSKIDILKRRSVNLESIVSAKEVEIENLYGEILQVKSAEVSNIKEDLWHPQW